MANGIYGQVPQALRESRLTLRDIMTDMAKTTAEDAKLKLALDAQKGQMEIERLQGEANLAKIAADRELAKGSLAERIRHNKAMEAIAKPESEMLQKSDSMRNWVLRYPGISSAMKDIAMKNLPKEELDQVMTGAEAKMLFESLNKNPGFFYRNLKGVVIDRLENIMGQLQDPNIDDAQRQAIFEQQYDPLRKQLDRIDVVLGDGEELKPEDMKAIKEMAIEYVKAGDGTVTEEEATEKALESVMKIRKAVHGPGKKFFPKTIKELLESKPTTTEEEGVDDKFDFKKYKPKERKVVTKTNALKDIASQPPVDFTF